MRRFAVALACVLVLAAGCESPAGQAEWTVGGGDWAGEVSDNGGSQSPAPRVLTLHFLDGTIAVRAGCNSHDGIPRVVGGRLFIDDLTMTLAGCPGYGVGWDGWIRDFLMAGPRWTQRPGLIELTTAHARVVLHPNVGPPPTPEIVGTRWSLDEVLREYTGPSNMPVLVPAPLGEIVFDGVQARAEVGCATVTGPASVLGGELTIGTLSVHGCAADARFARRVAAALADGKGSFPRGYGYLYVQTGSPEESAILSAL